MEQFNPGQIKKSIKQLKQREQEYLYYLGQLAFQAGEEGKLEDAAMLEAYRTLKDIQVQQVQGEATLEQIRAAKEAAQKPRCAQCGEPLPKGAVFCAKCGASLTAPPPMAAPSAPPAAGWLCPGCGAPLDEDAVFCGNCGARSGSDATEQAATVAEPAPPVSEAPAPSLPQAEAQAEPPAAETTAPAETAAEEPMPSAEETLACPKCGAGVPEKDMIFCSVCGTKVRE